MSFDLNSTKRIYSRLQDDYSRFLYEKRIMYSLTGNMTYADDILKSVVDSDMFNKLMDEAMSVKDRLVIRGAGNDYWVLKKLFPKLDFVYFVDNDKTKQGKIIDGKKVLTPEEFYRNYPNYYVMINSTAANHEIAKELSENGIPQDHMIDLGKCYERICDKQYFEKEIMVPDENEVFVDGGCYDGRTIAQFVKWCGGNYKKIYSFEPDPANYELVLARMKKTPLENVDIINKGLWSESTSISFAGNGDQGSRIDASGGCTIETSSIDEIARDDKVTFIKLDVEGAEYKALEGARRTIEKYHPKMAISIYHKPEDIFELPELILSMNGEYRFWLRHYQLSPNETILYAI